MKRTKLFAALTTTLMAAIAINGAASAAPPPTQTVEGSVALMAKYTDLASCYAGVHRRFAVVTQEMVNGIVGYHFDVDKATWNKPFRLTVSAPQPADLDITFYTEFGTVQQATETGYAPANISFEEKNTDGEFGKVPKLMNKAIVCMFDGVAADFTYTAGKGVK